MKWSESGAVSRGFLITAALLVIVGAGGIGYMRSNAYLPPDVQEIIEASESGNMDEYLKKIRETKITELTPDAEKGDIGAQLKLARLILQRHTPESRTAAFNWASKAAEHGDMSASSELAYYYECGVGTKKDIKKAIRLYTPYANQGDVLSQYALTGLETDPKKVKYWQDKVNKAMQNCPGCDLPSGGCM